MTTHHTTYETLKDLVLQIEILCIKIDTQKDIIHFMKTEQEHSNAYTTHEIEDEKFILRSLMEELKQLEKQERETEDCICVCHPAQNLKLPLTWSYL